MDMKSLVKEFGTPLFAYDEAALRKQAASLTKLELPIPLTVRYAMKANPLAAILQVFQSEGVKIDASSGFEAQRALKAGIAGDQILLTSQELPANLAELVDQGVQFNATSLNQLQSYGEQFPGGELTIRINPGRGSGANARLTVAGPNSSFGIWHEKLDKVQELIAKHSLKVVRVHTHIGTGTDYKVWEEVARVSINLLQHFPEATSLDLGGGFKVARIEGEKDTPTPEVITSAAKELELFNQRTGRKVGLEVEPGAYLIANAGYLLTEARDIVSTGKYEFIKVDSGMSELLRPALYGSQHPITNVTSDKPTKPYVVVGHCCESSDVLTPAPGDPESIEPRQLPETVIGDLLVIGGVGAYSSAMNAEGYNSFFGAAEVMVQPDGTARLLVRRGTLDDLMSREQL